MSQGCGSKVLRAKRMLQEAGVDTEGLNTKQKLLHARWKLKEERRLDHEEERRFEELIGNLEIRRDQLLEDVRGKMFSRMPTRSHGVEAHAFAPPQQANVALSEGSQGAHQELMESEVGAAKRAEQHDDVLSPGPLSAPWDKGQALKRSGGPSSPQFERREEEQEGGRGREEGKGQARVQAMLARFPIRRFMERLCGFGPAGSRL